MTNRSPSHSGFESLVAIVRRRGWIAFLVFLVPFSVVVGLVPSLPNIYRSTATVLVDQQQVADTLVKSTVTSAIEARLQTITQEILSRSRLADLIAQFGLYPRLGRRISPQALIPHMRKDIQFEVKGIDPAVRDRAAVYFTISFQGTDPQTVALVTNTLASLYIEENLKVRERQATGTTEFLNAQVMDTKKRLDEQERQLSDFKARHLEELPQLMESNLTTLERLRTQLRANGDTQMKVTERRNMMARQMAQGEFASTAAVPETTANKIARLKNELAQLRTQFRDSYPDIVRVKAELAARELELAQEPVDGKPTLDPPVRRGGPLTQAVDDVAAELKALQLDEQRLRAAIAGYERRLQNVPRREQEFQELSRDYQTTKELYRTFLSRYAEAQVAESMEQRQKGEQFRIIESAIPPDSPAAPKRLYLLVLGLAASIGLTVGAVTLAEKLDTSFHTPEDLRTLTRVPVLGSIAWIATAAATANQRVRFRLGALLAILAGAVLVVASHFIGRGNEQLVRLLAGGGGS